MLTGERELDLLNLLTALIQVLERIDVKQDKMVQALERLASAFQEDEDESGPRPVPPLRS